MKPRLYSTICILFFSINLVAQEQLSTDTIMHRIWQQTALFPQEKIYTRTDRPAYIAGDTIRFAVQIVNAISHRPEILSRYAYAELYNKDSLIFRTKVKSDSLGAMSGYIPLDKNLNAGCYQLRTYTRYSAFQKEPSISVRQIQIMPSKNLDGFHPKTEVSDGYDVQFFPEGGNLVLGTLCRVTFEAVSASGNTEWISGYILNSQKDTVASISTIHDGMGDFYLVPQPGETYHAVCFNEVGMEKSFQLPIAHANRLSFRIDTKPDTFRVSLSGKAVENMHLLVLQRSLPIYCELWNGAPVDFPVTAFREGTLHFLLLRENRIISERQAFVFPDRNICKISDVPVNTLDNTNPTQLGILLQDSAGNPLNGIASVSVTRNEDFLPDSLITIQTELLLSPDIQETLKNPGWYFGSAPAKERIAAMDLLMCVRGWRRYEVEPLLQGNYRKPEVLPEVSMQIAGKVTNRKGEGIANCNVSLGAPNAGVLEQTTSLDNGDFTFSGFEAPENTLYFVSATTEKGKENVYIVLEKDSIWFNQISFSSNIPKSICSVLPQRDKWVGYHNRALEKISEEEVMRHIYLQEVDVTAPKKKEYVTELERFADKVVTEERIRQSGVQTLRMALNALIGFRWPSFGEKYIGLWSPLLVFDDSPVYDDNTREYLLERLPVDDIGQIDIIKGAHAIGFYTGKNNLIISVSTKKGRGMGTYYERTNMNYITPLGYQKPAEVYAPKYKPTRPNMPDLRSVLLWQPHLHIENGKAKANFYIARSNLPVSVVVEGVTVDGNTFRVHKEITY